MVNGGGGFATVTVMGNDGEDGVTVMSLWKLWRREWGWWKWDGYICNLAGMFCCVREIQTRLLGQIIKSRDDDAVLSGSGCCCIGLNICSIWAICV